MCVEVKYREVDVLSEMNTILNYLRLLGFTHTVAFKFYHGKRHSNCQDNQHQHQTLKPSRKPTINTSYYETVTMRWNNTTYKARFLDLCIVCKHHGINPGTLRTKTRTHLLFVPDVNEDFIGTYTTLTMGMMQRLRALNRSTSLPDSSFIFGQATSVQVKHHNDVLKINGGNS